MDRRRGGTRIGTMPSNGLPAGSNPALSFESLAITAAMPSSDATRPIAYIVAMAMRDCSERWVRSMETEAAGETAFFCGERFKHCFGGTANGQACTEANY